MITPKKIIAILAILALIVGIIWFADQEEGVVAQESTENTISTTSPVTPTSAVSVETKPVVVPTQNKSITSSEAWTVFQNYIQAARTRDITALAVHAYSLSATCTNPEMKKECFALMDGVYGVGKNLSQTDYKNFMFDSKQAVLYTDARIESIDTETMLVKGYMYFGRDTQGNLKLLALDPSRGVKLNTGTRTRAELESKLKEMSVDSDMDTIPDLQERCLDSTGNEVVACTKTDSQKRDSRGDGWWDGVRIFLRK